MLKFSLHIINRFKKVISPKISFLLLGISSTLWFLIRVIPKPQRAAYPCMQAAAPFLSSFVIYLLSLFGSISLYFRGKKYWLKSRYLVAGAFMLASLLVGFIFFANNKLPVFANNASTSIANQPVGIARGIFPGRVVWVFNPAVAKYDGKTGFWWTDENTSQVETDKMLKSSLLNLTGEVRTGDAWNALFKSFNQRRNNSNGGYATGQKIAVKINQNCAKEQTDDNDINATPQLILSLLHSLVEEAGIPQNCITVFDASRCITDNIFSKCNPVFPEVKFVDNVGGNGRIKSEYVPNAVLYSVDNGTLAKGIAKCAVEADYLINMALLKGHPGEGTAITLCAKNYYGATSISINTANNSHINFQHDTNGGDRYITIVDYMGHKDLGEKTMLFMVDGIYGTKSNRGEITLKWKMPPFNNRWSSSLFLSQDGVAIDAVGLDFLRTEWPDLQNMAYVEKYLLEEAMADNPPSKTVYDPERDKTICKSMGVYESWNNPTLKQYSRNLGKNEGIELKLVDLSTATNELHLQNEPVYVYPNPTLGEMHFSNLVAGTVVSIFKVDGTMVMELQVENSSIDVSSLPAGQYIAKISDQGKTISKKFIKL